MYMNSYTAQVPLSFFLPSSVQSPMTGLESPYSLVHPNYALLKTGSEISEDVRCHNRVYQQADNDTSIRYNVKGGQMEIVALFILAVFVACMNHVLFIHLDGKEPGSHTSQFWVTVLKNLFPAAISFLLFTVLKHCLLQVAFHLIQRSSHPLETVDLISSPPGFLNTFLLLFKSSKYISIFNFALLTAITQAVTLTSLFVPGTLTVVPSPPRIVQNLKIPTIDFDLADPNQSSLSINTTSDFLYLEPSQQWRQLVIRAVSSSAAPTWNPPVGCGSACSYSFSYYSAPVLNCIDISGYHGGSPSFTFYNATFAFDFPLGESDPFLEIIYLDHFNATSLPDNGDVDAKHWFPSGARCVYQNATYEATTKFSNNTQISSTYVQEWHDRIYIDRIGEVFNEVFQGYALYRPEMLLVDTSMTQVLLSSLFTLTNSPGTPESFYAELKEPLFTIANNFFGTLALAFVNEQMATTFTDAIVTPDSTEYQYVSWRLGLIYGIVFMFSLMVIAYGLFCLRRNGIVAVFDLPHILEMTAESTRLHESATRPDFGSTLVRGVMVSDLDATRRRKMTLNISG
ncbi:hypothetical protein D9757_010197 [Collybiopsis confluens]|uniref:Transmembrane protein n=1 Tax=Collybiopsis confluens TaxID=2823264 RepID=A0A8H5LT69_9AGAR|nr:hypothetical protein D9757_010197 [Collybiopsis confluens]